MDKKSTHFVLQDGKILASTDLQKVFHFLIEIEKEIESLLGINKKIEELKKDYNEIFNYTNYLREKLKENKIDYVDLLSKNLINISDSLSFEQPFRWQLIALFANLEVIFNLHTAYEHEIDDEASLRSITMNQEPIKKFINYFLLTTNNKYYSEHESRFTKITSKDIRELRNSLTHFFSIPKKGVQLCSDPLSDQARKLENQLKKEKMGHVVFFSEQDFHHLINEAIKLRLEKWSNDFINNREDFQRKISHVISYVDKFGVEIIPHHTMKKVLSE